MIIVYADFKQNEYDEFWTVVLLMPFWRMLKLLICIV